MLRKLNVFPKGMSFASHGNVHRGWQLDPLPPCDTCRKVQQLLEKLVIYRDADF